MNRRFAVFAGAVTLTIATLGTNTAEAGRFRFSGGGRVHAHAHGHVSVGWSRPAYRPHRGWSVGGRIYVGPQYYPRYSYYPRYYYYTPVPSYYGVYSQPYYPVQPAYRPEPSIQVVAAPPPVLPKLGIGLFAGGVSVEDQSESSDVGILGRFRLGNGGLLVEAELGKTSYENDLRVDRRLGGSLVYEFGAHNKVAPYILAGLGVQQADVDGDFKTTQNFGEVGVGLRLAVSPRFHLLLDVRAGTRATASSDDPRPTNDDVAVRLVTPPSEDSNQSEDYTRARLAAMIYF